MFTTKTKLLFVSKANTMLQWNSYFSHEYSMLCTIINVPYYACLVGLLLQNRFRFILLPRDITALLTGYLHIHIVLFVPECSKFTAISYIQTVTMIAYTYIHHGIRSNTFKQHFDTRNLVFYNPSPPRMFLSLDLLSEYRIQLGAIGPLYVTSSYSTWIFCRGVLQLTVLATFGVVG